MASTDPVDPFGALLAGVKALVPEAPLPEALAAGERGVTAGQVVAWIGSLSSQVDLRLTGWRRLRDVATAEEEAAGELAPRARLEAAAADLVQNGAASYLEAARFPERARPADSSSYAAVLWARYVDGLTALAGWLTAELEDASPPDDVLTARPSGLAYSFPDPSFTPDTMRW